MQRRDALSRPCVSDNIYSIRSSSNKARPPSIFLPPNIIEFLGSSSRTATIMLRMPYFGFAAAIRHPVLRRRPSAPDRAADSGWSRARSPSSERDTNWSSGSAGIQIGRAPNRGGGVRPEGRREHGELAPASPPAPGRRCRAASALRFSVARTSRAACGTFRWSSRVLLLREELRGSRRPSESGPELQVGPRPRAGPTAASRSVPPA